MYLFASSRNGCVGKNSVDVASYKNQQSFFKMPYNL